MTATFVYVDYGPSRFTALELRYSLATLLAEIPSAAVHVYTDKPAAYEKLTVTPRALDWARWTRHGAYAHRVKPCVLIDALRAQGGLCVLLDTDSFIAPGFASTIASVREAAMDRFEARDPYPEIAGFRAELPHAGAYIYQPETAVMFNSGLIAARDAAPLEDAVALIDALWDAGRRLFKIEQIAVSEAFRLNGLAIGEAHPAFQHYFRRSLKRYMRWRLDAWSRQAFAPTRPLFAPSRNAVRAFNLVNHVLKRY